MNLIRRHICRGEALHQMRVDLLAAGQRSDARGSCCRQISLLEEGQEFLKCGIQLSLDDAGSLGLQLSSLIWLKMRG